MRRISSTAFFAKDSSRVSRYVSAQPSILSEGRVPAAYRARKTLKPVSGSCSPISIRGLTTLAAGCAYALGGVTNPAKVRLNATIRIFNDHCDLNVEYFLRMLFTKIRLQHRIDLFLLGDSLECADLSALCPVATCRDYDSLESTHRLRRQAAADQSGDRSPHSK